MITDELMGGTEGWELLRSDRNVSARINLVQINILFADSVMSETRDMTPVEVLHNTHCTFRTVSIRKIDRSKFPQAKALAWASKISLRQPSALKSSTLSPA
jgi:hypothetical protein